jgi:hypothetical protein
MTELYADDFSSIWEVTLRPEVDDPAEVHTVRADNVNLEGPFVVFWLRAKQGGSASAKETARFPSVAVRSVVRLSKK